MPPHRAPDCVKQDINKTILKSVLILLLSRRSHRNLEPSKKPTDSDDPECLPVFPSVQSSFPFEVGKLLTSSSKTPNSKMAAALLTNKSKRLVFFIRGLFCSPSVSVLESSLPVVFISENHEHGNTAEAERSADRLRAALLNYGIRSL